VFKLLTWMCCSLLMATSLSLSLIASPHSYALHSLPALLRGYFRFPRVLCEGDIIPIRIPFLIGKSTSLNAFDDVDDDVIQFHSSSLQKENDALLRVLCDTKNERWIYFHVTKLEHKCGEENCKSDTLGSHTYVVDHRVTRISHVGMKRFSFLIFLRFNSALSFRFVI